MTRRARGIALCLSAAMFAAIAYLVWGVMSVCNCGPGGEDLTQPADEACLGRDGNPYYILVDCEESRLYLFKDSKLFREYRCAGGKESTPSPIGTWTIVSKATWNEGFGGRWMGFDVPWGKFGIHGTIFPNSIGWPSSKGCIRMRNKDVRELYSIVPCGTKVTIVDGCYGVWGRGIRTLRPGMYGADVLEVQKRLKELGFYYGSCNGRYDSKGFREAVHRYQVSLGLKKSDTITPWLIKRMGLVAMD